MKIHVHTDCPFFSGSENMIAILSIYFHTDNKPDTLSISYRKSLKYDETKKERLNSIEKLFGLYLIDINDLILYTKNLFLRKLLVLISIIVEPVQFLYNTLILFLFLKRKNIDLLHINNGGYPGADSCNAAVIAAKICGIKKITYTVNNIIVPYHGKRKLGFLFDRILIRSVDKFITASKFAGKKIINTLGLNKNQYRQLFNGISPRCIEIDKKKFLKKYGLENSSIVFGVVGILEERKGHIFLIDAINMIKKTGNTLPKVLIEGEGPLFSKLKRKVEEENLSKYIIFTGRIDNIFELYNSIDCLIIPSIRNEDFPNVVIEAMAMGKGIIGTDIAGIPEQIENNGIIVESKNIEQLADAIQKVLRSPSIINEWGKESKKIFELKYNACIAVKRYKEMWRELLND